jgi:hypothetical protein
MGRERDRQTDKGTERQNRDSLNALNRQPNREEIV